MNIWIIDDENVSLAKARSAVEATARELNVSPAITSLDHFTTPKMPPRPSILVLDLINDTTGDIVGHTVYNAVRGQEEKEEQKKSSVVAPSTFVIVWTKHTEFAPDSLYFPDAYNDTRLYWCHPKSEVNLRKMLRTCIGRIRDEDE